MAYPIGIDLGTTNCVAAVWQRGQAVTIPVDGQGTLPSAISVRSDGILIGQPAKGRAQIAPASSVTSVKRFIGDGKTKWEIEGKTYTPVDVSAMLLERLKEAAQTHLGEAITEAVITVPAYFNNNQKRDTKLAGEAAGFEVLQLLPEPTAAAIQYGLDKGKNQTLLVYDLGGGTFDVSILEVKENDFNVVAVDGDFHLGGDDFDLLLVDHLIGLIEEQTKEDMGLFRSLFGRKGKKKKGSETATREMLLARQRLKEAAEIAKIELSQADRTCVSLPNILGTSLDEEITIDTYNRLIEPMVARTIEKIREVLASARLTSDDIDRVILVGGSTRNRLVKEQVTKAVKEPWTSEHVDEAVAQGAAIVAGSMAAPDLDMTPVEININNVTPFSLGVCSYEKESTRCINSIIIHKNRPVPCEEARPYELQTAAGRDNKLEAYMLQGESENPAECLVIGKYIFTGVSHTPGSLAKVEIQYGYDKNGIITAAAREQSTGKALELHVEALPDDMTWLDEISRGGSFDPSNLKLIVTPPGYDDVGSVLTSLQLPFIVYTERQPLDCDIFFWNCLASTHPSAEAIRDYVSDGGCLYASCCAARDLDDAFPGAIEFDHSGCRSETIQADVIDMDLTKTVGKNLRIQYNTAACYTVSLQGPGSKVLLREAATGKDVMVMVPFGKGHIFYTCFHHHEDLSKDEKSLLQFLVMKQISVVSGIPIEAVSSEIRT